MRGNPAEILRTAAMALLAGGDPAGAAAMAQRAFDEAEGLNVDVLQSQARSLGYQGHWTEAVVLHRTLIEQETVPDDRARRLGELGAALAEAGRADEVQVVLERLTRLESTLDVCPCVVQHFRAMVPRGGGRPGGGPGSPRGCP